MDSTFYGMKENKLNAGLKRIKVKVREYKKGGQ
jgi:hypothetical protein